VNPKLDLLQVLSLTVTALFGGGGAVAAYNARIAKRRGVASDEREARRDAQADWSTFATEMRQALAEERQDSAAKTSRIDALTVRLEAKDAGVRQRDDHIDVLEAWIWARKEPPPPPRPYTD
jgi:hypothetical protein